MMNSPTRRPRPNESVKPTVRITVIRLMAALPVACLVATGSALAQTPTINIYSNSGGNDTLPGNIPFALLNLGTGAANSFVTSSTVTSASTPVAYPSSSQISSIAFTSASTPSGVYAGASGNAVSPFGQNDTTTNYLVAGSGTDSAAGTVTVSYTQPQTSMNMLWGSINSTPASNLITFLSSSGTTVATLDGSQIATVISGFSTATTNAAVNLSNISPFVSVVFSEANGSAFELALGTATSTIVFGGRGVPEPASLALLATSVSGLAFMRRRRKTP